MGIGCMYPAIAIWPRASDGPNHESKAGLLFSHSPVFLTNRSGIVAKMGFKLFVYEGCHDDFR